MVSALLSGLLGLVRSKLIAYFFGVGPAVDAYTGAFQLPDTISYLLIGGVASTTFVKLLTQYESEGNFLPGLGYLAKFEELVKKINDPTNGPNAKAELAYLIKKFEPATLFLLEQAKSHSESLLIDWLSLHKFKDWNQTATSKTTVTSDMRKARAKQIAEVLGDATRWHSHGRGIGLRELTSDEIKLQIFDFGSMDALNRLVRDYYETLCDFAGRTPAKGYIHTVNGLRRLT